MGRVEGRCDKGRSKGVGPSGTDEMVAKEVL